MKMFKTLAAFGVLALAGSVMAATSSHYLNVNIPFAFVVSGRQFAPGAYSIMQDTSGMLIVQGHGNAAAVLTVPAGSVPDQSSKVKFQTGNNNREYLVGVTMEGEGSRAIPGPDTRERKLTLSH